MKGSQIMKKTSTQLQLFTVRPEYWPEDKAFYVRAVDSLEAITVFCRQYPEDAEAPVIIVTRFQDGDPDE